MNYEKIYNDIISKARSEDRKKIKGGIYYERHHIIPRCLGGSNDKSNLILLTAKEHYIAHRLLCMIYPTHEKILYAMWCMINGRGQAERYIPSSRIYTLLKTTHSTLMCNRIVSENTKKKMSEAAFNRPKRIMSDITKEKLALARSKRVPKLKKEKIINQKRPYKKLTSEERELLENIPRPLRKKSKSAQIFYIF
jgi:hypothetical protein